MDRVMLGSQTADYVSGMSSMLSKYYEANEVELMNNVKLPTLIIFGIEDQNKSMNEALQLRNGFSNSRLEIIQNAGHYVHEESPNSVSKIMIESVNFLTNKND
jgi:pimeloyl-ACP methyl ester carboxylesterase